MVFHYARPACQRHGFFGDQRPHFRAGNRSGPRVHGRIGERQIHTQAIAAGAGITLFLGKGGSVVRSCRGRDQRQTGNKVERFCDVFSHVGSRSRPIFDVKGRACPCNTIGTRTYVRAADIKSVELN